MRNRRKSAVFFRQRPPVPVQALGSPDGLRCTKLRGERARPRQRDAILLQQIVGGMLGADSRRGAIGRVARNGGVRTARRTTATELHPLGFINVPQRSRRRRNQTRGTFSTSASADPPRGARGHLVRVAMSLTMCSASLPTPGRNPDDIA
jgi:hypothetical protein